MNTPIIAPPASYSPDYKSAPLPPRVASELAAPKTAGPAPVVAAVSTGSGWVSAGLLLQLARAWDRTANKEKHEAELCRDHTNMVGHFAIHGAYKTASQELRLLVEDATERQPEENK